MKIFRFSTRLFLLLLLLSVASMSQATAQSGLSARILTERLPWSAAIAPQPAGTDVVQPVPPMEPAICTPDCPFTNWNHGTPYPLPLTLTLANGCQVVIEYYQRHACSTYYDVQISKISFNASCFPPGTTLAQILDMAYTALILLNPMNFPPTGNNQCNENWRAVKASCWKYVADPGGSYYEPCQGFDCCLKFYTVCTDGDGVRTITVTGTSYPATNNCTSPCISVCQ